MQENKGKLFMLGYKSLNSVLGERDRWVNLVLSFSWGRNGFITSLEIRAEFSSFSEICDPGKSARLKNMSVGR